MSDTRIAIGQLVLSVTSLSPRRYAVRPDGQLGTCGFHPYAWTVVCVTARTPVDAVRKAYPKVMQQRAAVQS